MSALIYHFNTFAC